MKSQNNFGGMRTEYESARRGYPQEVYNYIHNLLGRYSALVLDLGCGTGISSRELKENGFEVVGADKDEAMIETARERSPEIKYVAASADHLPFPDREFDIVTAFTAFHWFNDEKSLNEIKRVLKKGGVFFAALKGNRQSEETKAFRNGYTAIFKKYAGQDFDKTKEHFKTDIMSNIFGNITEKSFYVDERYTVENALVLIRSISLWNLISEADKPKLMEEMKEFYEKNLIDGFVVRNREIFTLSGIK